MIRILTGANNFLLRSELKRLAAEFEAEYGDMALERLDGEEAAFERIQEALQSLPFLVSKKLVVLEAPGANKQFVEQVEILLEELPESTDLIIVEPKLDKRSSYYKLLKKQSGFQEFPELDERGLSQWLVDLAKQEGATLSLGDALYLVGRVGTNQQKLGNELIKLILYDAKITRASIDELTAMTPQSTIFELLEAAFAGKTKRALDLYAEQRILKVEPQQIIAMLAWQLHVLALVKMAGNRTPEAIASEAKLNPYVVKRSAGIARKLSVADTKRLIADLLAIDHRLKREPLNADDALMGYLMQLAAMK